MVHLIVASPSRFAARWPDRDGERRRGCLSFAHCLMAVRGAEAWPPALVRLLRGGGTTLLATRCVRVLDPKGEAALLGKSRLLMHVLGGVAPGPHSLGGRPRGVARGPHHLGRSRAGLHSRGEADPGPGEQSGRFVPAWPIHSRTLCMDRRMGVAVTFLGCWDRPDVSVTAGHLLVNTCDRACGPGLGMMAL